MTRDRPSAEEAFAAYVALGADRSLKKLRDRLAADYSSAPCLRSLKTWSAAGGWRDRVNGHADLAQALAAADGSPINRSMAANMHRIALRLMQKAARMAMAAEDGDAGMAAVVADIGVKISRVALDVERGRPPSAERLAEIMASIGKDPGTTNVVEMPGAATPEVQAKPSILKQFDMILGDKDKAH